MSAAANWREWLLKLRIPGLEDEWGQKLLGVLGLEADTLSLGLTCTLRCGLIQDPYCLADHLALKGEARNLPRYPAETLAQYRARVFRALDDWEMAGVETALCAQLQAAGYTSASIKFRPYAPGPRGPVLDPAPYWSQFWVVVPDLGVTKNTSKWNDGHKWNDGSTWGSTSITSADAATLRAIVRKFKPVDWVCRGFLFPIYDGFDWNDGTKWNDGTTWGGFLEMEF
jgi:hypothetical protein